MAHFIKEILKISKQGSFSAHISFWFSIILCLFLSIWNFFLNSFQMQI